MVHNTFHIIITIIIIIIIISKFTLLVVNWKSWKLLVLLHSHLEENLFSMEFLVDLVDPRFKIV